MKWKFWFVTVLAVFWFGCVACSETGEHAASDSGDARTPPETQKKAAAPPKAEKKESAPVRGAQYDRILKEVGYPADEVAYAYKILDFVDFSEYEDLEKKLRAGETVADEVIGRETQKVGQRISSVAKTIPLESVDPEIAEKVRGYISLYAFLILKEDNYFAAAFNQINARIYPDQANFDEKIIETKKRLDMNRDALLFYFNAKVQDRVPQVTSSTTP